LNSVAHFKNAFALATLTLIVGESVVACEGEVVGPPLNESHAGGATVSVSGGTRSPSSTLLNAGTQSVMGGQSALGGASEPVTSKGSGGAHPVGGSEGMGGGSTGGLRTSGGTSASAICILDQSNLDDCLLQ